MQRLWLGRGKKTPLLIKKRVWTFEYINKIVVLKILFLIHFHNFYVIFNDFALLIICYCGCHYISIALIIPG